MDSKVNSIVKARKSIEDDIFNGLLYPRQRLIEEEIASRLGMSRTPVREALKQLEVEGLVTRLPTRGLVVTEITVEDIRYTFEVREALETMAVRLVCQRISDRELDNLKMYLENHRLAVEQGLRDSNGVIDPYWSILFHSEMYLACHNPKIIRYIEQLWDIERLINVSKYFRESEYTIFHEQHAELLEAITQRDQERATKAVKAHLDTMCHLYTKYI